MGLGCSKATRGGSGGGCPFGGVPAGAFVPGNLVRYAMGSYRALLSVVAAAPNVWKREVTASTAREGVCAGGWRGRSRSGAEREFEAGEIGWGGPNADP
jgi:hypothetical protein